VAVEPEKLKREAAGRYVTGDGRFSIEQSSGRWVAIDAETTDDLGLPLVRGPFDTLDEAKAAIAAARTGPKATSSLADRLKATPTRGQAREVAAAGASARKTSKGPTEMAPKPREPQIDLRDFTPADGDALRQVWKAAGFGSAGDDDRSLAAFAQRNPGGLVVATADGEVIGGALGGWDGRRGWIYHVAVAVAFRRQGIATRLVRRVEQRLRVAGAAKINTIVPAENRPAKAFWASLGYELTPTSQYAREI